MEALAQSLSDRLLAHGGDLQVALFFGGLRGAEAQRLAINPLSPFLRDLVPARPAPALGSQPS